MSNISSSQWLQNRFTSLYEAAPPPEEADFKALFLSIFSENAQVVYNHETISVDVFQEKLTAANYAAKEASIDWKDLVEIPANDKEQEFQVWFQFTHVFNSHWVFLLFL